MPTENDLREALKDAGFTRQNSLGECWKRDECTVTIGANEIVVVDQTPSRVTRRLNRAVGGLALAIEYVKEDKS